MFQAQKIKGKQIIDTAEKQKSGWTSVFPATVVTEQTSTLFVKKLIAVAISNLVYLRSLFPEEAFGDRSLEGLHLKVLKEDPGCPGSTRLISWIKGAFDALEKKYLRRLILGIYLDPNDSNTVIESYTFRFVYTQEGAVKMTCNVLSGAKESTICDSSTYKATLAMLRTIIVLIQSLKPLPDDVMLTMRILYYDEGKSFSKLYIINTEIVTPADYEPPGFFPSEFSDFMFKNEPISIRLGDVETSFHAFKLRIQTSKDQFTETASIEETQEEITQKLEIEESQPIPPNITPNQFDIIRCPCGVQENDGLMIFCEKCNTWQHGSCFGISKPDEAPSQHICELCHNYNQQCTDTKLVELTIEEKEMSCLVRRAMNACHDFSRILPSGLARRLGISMQCAAKIIAILEKENILHLSKPKGLVNKENLEKKILFHYIHKYDSDDMSARTKRLTLQSTDRKRKNINTNIGMNNEAFEISCSQEDETHKRKKASTVKGIHV